MIPGFSKQTITIGSGPNCDIRLGGPGVAPEHARIVHQGNGQLMLVDGGAGQTFANGQPVAPGSSTPFDFRTQFVVGQAAIPNAHPAIALMLMAKGTAQLTPGSVTFGRDPARCHIVIQNPSVSGAHTTVQVNPLQVTDLGSTSGTWLGQERLQPNAPRPVDLSALIAVGPVPVPAQLAVQLASALRGDAANAAAGYQAPETGGQAAVGGGQARKKHKTVIGQVALGGAGGGAVKSIGRTPANDIQIDHPQVSSKHAALHMAGGQLLIEDRGSANGTYVRGQRIAPGQKVPVQNGEKVFIGPMPLVIQVDQAQEQVQVYVEDTAGWAGRPLYEIEAWDLVIQVKDRDNPREMKTLLDRVSFKALPGDLIALMGPSGAGKTTLLLALNGYMPPTHGQVRINGEDLYSIYDVLRGSIGYVPQDDIVHPELTVWEAVRYSAKFRLPPDFSEEEIDRRVETTLRQLGLDSVKHLQIGKPEKKVLSGGQRKRVNIALELVTDPVIMFLDEPTSGLAADDTTALVQLLSDLARSTGKTIITTIHQPAKDEFEKFNLALILGVGGVPIFYGSPRDGYRFFGSFKERNNQVNDVDNPRDMFDMLNQRETPILNAMRAQDPNASRQAARQAAAREWHQEYYAQNSPYFQKMYSGRRAVGQGSQQQVSRSRPKAKGQFGLLLSRYRKVKFRDTTGTVIMFAQAPIIGVLLAMVFGLQKQAIPYWCLGALQELAKRYGLGEGTSDVLTTMQPTPDNSGAINFLVVAAVWFGTSNAAREIVSERAIYLRERMVNLGIFNYVFSKFVLLSFFALVQCSVLLGIVFFALGFNGGIQAFAIELGMLVAVAMNSTALGLLLSTLVMSSEAAMALTPIALIPQVVLSGLMVPMTTNPYLKWMMYGIPARWGFEGIVAQERAAIADDPAWIIDLKQPDKSSPPDFLVGGRFRCAEAQIASDNFNGAWGFEFWEWTWLPPTVLSGTMLLLLFWILIILKRRDRV